MHLINVFGDDALPEFACSERKRTRKDALDEIEIYISHMFASTRCLEMQVSPRSLFLDFSSSRLDTTKERSHNMKMKIISTKRLN